MHNYAIISSVHEGEDDAWFVHMQRSINHRRFGLDSGGCLVYFCHSDVHPINSHHFNQNLRMQSLALERWSLLASRRLAAVTFAFSIFDFMFSMPVRDSRQSSVPYPFIARNCVCFFLLPRCGCVVFAFHGFIICLRAGSLRFAHRIV